MSDDVLLARAYLSRVAEPCRVALWALVCREGPVAAAEQIAAGEDLGSVTAMTEARRESVDPVADLEAAARRGIRLVVPESPEWPHFALGCLERTGEALLRAPRTKLQPTDKTIERVPPLALWVRGPGDLAGLATRSVGIVGARAATGYGTYVARDMAGSLADRGFDVVSGGAFGIDAAAHHAALAVGGSTVIVSAAGLDRAYPVANARLFDDAASTGLIVSESPPGSAPQRRRFLTRNRLIAALSTGTVVVEASVRSGAMNTATHCRALGRPVMAVPGPVTSAMSAGCHALLSRDGQRAELVTNSGDVMAVIGSSSDLPPAADRPQLPGDDGLGSALRQLDETVRHVFDGMPAGRSVTTSEIVVAAGVSAGEVFQALPVLELAGLVEQDRDGFRITSRRRSGRQVSP